MENPSPKGNQHDHEAFCAGRWRRTLALAVQVSTAFQTAGAGVGRLHGGTLGKLLFYMGERLPPCKQPAAFTWGNGWLGLGGVPPGRDAF